MPTYTVTYDRQRPKTVEYIEEDQDDLRAAMEEDGIAWDDVIEIGEAE